MKLRIQGNSLRLRLSQSEVAQFSKTGFVEDSIQFGAGASFAYTIESPRALPAPQATYQNHWLRIQVPAPAGQDWFTTDRVGISSSSRSTAKDPVDPDRKGFSVPARRR